MSLISETAFHEKRQRAVDSIRRPYFNITFLRGNFRLLVTWPLLAFFILLLGWSSLLNRLQLQHQEIEQNALRETADLARNYADQLNRIIDSVDQVLRHVRYEWELTNGHLRLEDSEQHGLLQSPSLFNVGITGRDGRIVTNTIKTGKVILVSDRLYFLTQQNASGDDLYIGVPELARTTRRSVVHFSRRLTGPDKEFDGIVRASVTPEYLTANYNATILGRHGLLAIVGVDGTPRATRVGNTMSDWNHTALKMPSLLVTREQMPFFITDNGSQLLDKGRFADGRRRFVGWQKVEHFPLIALAGFDEANTMAPYIAARHEAIEQAIFNTAVLILFTLIAMGLSLRLAWRKHQAGLTQAAYRMATEQGNEGFYICRAIYDRNSLLTDFELVDCNQTGAAFYGRQPDHLIGNRISALYRGQRLERVMRCLTLAMERGVFEDDVELPGPTSAEPRSRWVHLAILRSDDTLAVTMQDITESKEHVLALERKGNEDALTGLPNRHWLNAYLPEAIKQTASKQNMLALLFIDLDGFKTVNDTMGHDAGDDLLRNAGRRLKLAVRPHDHVARIGGDEFVVIVENIGDKDDAAHVAERVLRAFKGKFKLPKGAFSVGTSIGIGMYPDDAANAETLIKHADIAMYSVKTSGKANFRFFDQQFYEAVQARHDKEAELRYAIEHDQLVLHYQPRVDISAGTVCSMEALVRWAHPEKGIIEPLEFIPLAEETGLILPLGEIVIDKVCAQLSYWAQRGQELVPVSINVSCKQFNEANVANVLAQSLARHKVDARLVEIELTESAMAEGSSEVTESLNAIQDMGVNLCVDDFGTGYSSFSQLHRLDFDVLKVDRAFTAELDKTKEGVVFFTAIITMAHALGMRVVAEGVETLDQIRRLKELRCDEIQGYYISRPLPPTDTQPILPNRFLPSTA